MQTHTTRQTQRRTAVRTVASGCALRRRAPAGGRAARLRAWGSAANPDAASATMEWDLINPLAARDF